MCRLFVRKASVAFDIRQTGSTGICHIHFAKNKFFTLLHLIYKLIRTKNFAMSIIFCTFACKLAQKECAVG